MYRKGSRDIIIEQRSLKSGEVTQHETQNRSAATMRLQTESFTTEKNTMAAQQQSQTITSSGVINQHLAQSTHQNITYSKGMSTKTSVISSQMSHLMNGQALKMIENDFLPSSFDDLETLSGKSSPQEVEKAKEKYKALLEKAIKKIKSTKGESSKQIPSMLNRVYDMIRKAWEVPTYGHELGTALCNTLRTSGGLDFLLTNNTDDEQQFASAKLLEQCLTTENRDYVVGNGLEMVVKSACVCTKNSNSVEHSRVGTGILEHLFKHSEATCSDVIRLGGLDSVLFECRKNDVETLRHCAGALANLSLYGGAENHEAMIKRKVPMWLFPLAFHNDDNIKYYACLAIAALVANTEIEAAVLKSGTLNLVEPFITTHNPSEFANSNLAHAHGQSKHWLQRLVPVLSSKREEARNLAAFHFCMEAGIKKQQGNTELFRDIGAIEPLKKVASCPNAIASKFAAQALRLIGEEIPHKLSQQVPLWSTEDVKEWVKQIGFAECATNFSESRVDGDLLLQLTEDNLKFDIGITNGIRRKRFTRELQNLKKMADYSSRDVSNLNSFLSNIGPEFCIYTYSMLNAGVDKETLRCLSDEQLLNECGISNSIHRYRMLDSIRAHENTLGTSFEENIDKSLDVFVSYRRSNGSQLASLLKVHLQLRGFSVFIDVERLEAGKFDNNLLQSIRQAKHFLLVLTPHALDRCIADDDCKDWVHREIVAALQSSCNIVPITDNFQWPDPETLPEDMRAVCHFNGVMWIHDYQDACVDKLERWIRWQQGLTRRARQATQVNESNGECLASAHQPQKQEPSQQNSGSCTSSLAKRRGITRFTPLNIPGPAYSQCTTNRSSTTIGGDGRSIGNNHFGKRYIKKKTQLRGSLGEQDMSLVVSAPTGSGKTTLFELAIIRLLETWEQSVDECNKEQKIVYMAPIKALCTEKFREWEKKFTSLGIRAIEITGDSDGSDLIIIQHFNLILTTPEKWDALTRKWKDHASLIQMIKLFLIDEVHLLNEDKRGPTLEVVVSRMKTVQETIDFNNDKNSWIRFIAVSATIPNIEDIAQWLSLKQSQAKIFKYGEEMRPVHLKRIVKAYSNNDDRRTGYKFDLYLNYKLKQLIMQYSEGKPTLIFCSSRKSVLTAANVLCEQILFQFTLDQRENIDAAAEFLQDHKLKEMVRHGVAYHHAGLLVSDRHCIEELFRSGYLPVLVSTSTLAMGVNLPASLVIIKSTEHYVCGGWQEYSEGQILQMVGRAGRPQFGDSATAIILTKDVNKVTVLLKLV
ncbi:hypothetical protein O3M35_001186 [Rhynocoris fuscipes]|uniref:ADP-ribosyl cyclase/cyclic ADP-ribose hydrolase n=1 Tax=Rhynocoris fuscipes TaxID=488301 RepID=A0AAW1DQV1_9HEMI